jgi:hypothetical protein
MDNKYMKKYSTSLVIREMQIKITLRVYLILVKMGINQKTKKQQMLALVMTWGGVLYTVGGNVKSFSNYGNQYGGSSKLKAELP